MIGRGCYAKGLEMHGESMRGVGTAKGNLDSP